MKRLLLVLTGIWILSATFPQGLKAQDSFLHEIDLSTDLWKNEHWQLQATGIWKHIHNNIGWSRVGLNPTLNYRTGPWTLSGGLSNYYTFDSEIQNFWEVRTWVGASFTFRLLKGVDVGQRIRSEWRKFFSSGDIRWENYHRFRYALWLGFRLWDNPNWSQRLQVEQYILDAPADRERFPTERDFNLSFFHKLPNAHQFSFGFELEFFYTSQLQDVGHAYVIILGYRI